MKLSVFHISESASHYIYVDKLDFLLNSGSISPSPSTRCVRRASQLQESLVARLAAAVLRILLHFVCPAVGEGLGWLLDRLFANNTATMEGTRGWYR